MKIPSRLLVGFAAALTFIVFSVSPGVALQSLHKEYFPNVQLVTQDGKKVRFYDDVIKGKIVALNFVYTSCPDVCPLDTAALRRVQTLIGDRMGKDIFFYSITLDPAHDTPQVLKAYMKKFAVGPGWTFLTGRPEDIALIQNKFGIKPPSQGMLSEHDTRFIMGNEAISRWIKRTPHDNPHVLAHIMTRDLPGPRMARSSAALPSYTDADRITGMTEGGKMFMTRCSACHTIGGGDGQLGPDLIGVVDRRPRAWLSRWIKEPDRMIAEKDPATLAMMAKYRNLAMPNLKLNDNDVADVIQYIADESQRVKTASSQWKATKVNEDHKH